jgi:hypothetical protein
MIDRLVDQADIVPLGGEPYSLCSSLPVLGWAARAR